MKISHLISVVLITATGLAASFADPWDGYNNPEKMGRGRYNYDFYELPKSAELSNSKLPWSDTFFPTRKGGIAYRWQLGRPSTSWSYKLYSRAELMNLAPEVIAKLSPAEKFDIWMGDYTYPTVRFERGRSSPGAASWTGICHGWAPAAILHREPAPKTMTNPDGIEIPFGSSDIKALLIHYYGKVEWKPIGWTGKRCKGDMGGKGCRGVNPGTLHIVMANQIGLLDESFIMDRDRKAEIWNQPFIGYVAHRLGSCRVSGASARAGATHGIRVKMRAKWVNELPKSKWEPALKTDPESGAWVAKTKMETYEYCLELSGSGRIVGGEWISWERPGFIWNHALSEFSHPYHGKVKELIDHEPAAFLEGESAGI